MSEEDKISYTPAWLNAALTLTGDRNLNYGDFISHEELNALLNMPEPKTSLSEYKEWTVRRISQIEALSRWFLEERNMCLASVHAEGYRILQPSDQTQYAQESGMKVIRRELSKMARRIHYIDRSKLTHEQARDNANAMARAAFLKQQINRAARIKFDPPSIEE